jgi:hypothetical protein
LRQEDVTRVLRTVYPLVTPQEVEQAVIERLQAKEKSAEIQDMIARFFDIFDELHEQSVKNALARSPNRVHVKNEIKYKKPERWTRKFHKHDIIGRIIAGEQHLTDDRGVVNRQGMQTLRGHNRQGSNNANTDESLQAISCMTRTCNRQSLPPKSNIQGASET